MFSFNHQLFLDQSLASVRIFIPGFAGIKTGDRVLDVCCGSGAQVFYCADLGIDAVGIDRNKKIIGYADKKIEKNGIKNALFLAADAGKIPFKNESFDCASITLGLHENNKEAIDGIISEMKRVVKKGGSLIFVDLFVPLPAGYRSCLIKLTEYLTGRKTFDCFRRYISGGGLDVILERNGLRVSAREYLKNKTLVAVKAEPLC